jgi:hypothetical protein
MTLLHFVIAANKPLNRERAVGNTGQKRIWDSWKGSFFEPTSFEGRSPQNSPRKYECLPFSSSLLIAEVSPSSQPLYHQKIAQLTRDSTIRITKLLLNTPTFHRLRHLDRASIE